MKLPMSVMEEVVNNVERDIRNEVNQEISTDRIGELVLQQLKDIDQVAYVRFASVYRSFKDVGELENLLKQMISKGSKVKTGIKDEAK